MTTGRDLYRVLGLTASASDIEIRRAYRTLVSTAHPDKGGDPRRFHEIQQAYSVLSDHEKRRYYDATGDVEKSADEEFMDIFADGKFRDCAWKDTTTPANVEEQIALRNSAEFRSHTAGFDAWMRSRGPSATEVFTAETIADAFGVTKSSYTSVPLTPVHAHGVCIEKTVRDVNSLHTSESVMPTALEWGQVMVEMRYAAMNPADFYTMRSGTYGYEPATFPYNCGHDGIGVVAKVTVMDRSNETTGLECIQVGPGVTSLSEGDWVIPFKPFFGTWRTHAVSRASELLKVPSSLMQMEYGAVLKEMCLAYRLLEDHGKLKPGDWVILNAANSTVGQLVIQLCRLLHLKCIAVVRPRDPQKLELLSHTLTRLGATLVLKDDDSLKMELQKHKYSAKPKLGLDAVGGTSTIRLTESLADDGELVIYGCMTGQAPAWKWQSWVFKNIKVLKRGLPFSGDSIAAHRLIQMIEALIKLIHGKKLDVNYTEYHFPDEFEEAICHAVSNAKDSKILFKISGNNTNETAVV